VTGKAVHFYKEVVLLCTCKNKIGKWKTLCFTTESDLKVLRAEPHFYRTCHCEDLPAISRKKEIPKET